MAKVLDDSAIVVVLLQVAGVGAVVWLRRYLSMLSETINAFL